MEVLSDLAKALMLIAGVVSSYVALRQYWREDRTKFIKSLWMFLGYAIYCGVGIAAIVWIAPGPPPAGEDGGVKAAAEGRTLLRKRLFPPPGAGQVIPFSRVCATGRPGRR